MASNITLISDWKLQDPYVSMFKGRLLQRMPEANLLDMTHDVDILNTNQSAFLQKGAYQNFPADTVHIDLVGVTDNLEEFPIMMKWDGHYFVGRDNGLFSMMFFDHLSEIEIRRYEGEEEGFWNKMVELSAACLDGTWESRTEVLQTYRKPRPFEANYFAFRNHISGMVVYIDAQSNVLTNIPVTMFREALQSGTFEAMIGSVKITKFYENYVRDPEPYFVPNSMGMMEVATYGGRVALLARWQKDTGVEIDFRTK